MIIKITKNVYHDNENYIYLHKRKSMEIYHVCAFIHIYIHTCTDVHTVISTKGQKHVNRTLVADTVGEMT